VLPQGEVGLPVYPTRFVGRRAELAELRRLLSGSARLVTVVGVGGSGKTRIAAELARSALPVNSAVRFRHGVVWTDLDRVTDPDELRQAVGRAFGLPGGVELDTAEALARALTDQHALLVLDNCEELAAACRTLIEVLVASCPHLVVLATSRTSLHPALEHLMALPPMHATAKKDERSEAADLFYDRAGRVLPAYPHQAGDLATVNRLCERLDGLPLAIELAAPWVRTLSARDLLIEIERSADLLASTHPTVTGRHRSMRAVWDSTWRSLAADEQRALSSLSVFRGGFSAEAGEAVADASPAILRSLSERALIRPPTESVNRYELHELVRQYADDVLQGAGPATVAAVRQAHLDYFLRLYERALPDVDTPRERQWRGKLRVELPNAGAALGWALDSDRLEPALRMTAALTPVWAGVSGMGPHLARFETALALPWDRGSAVSVAARARVLGGAGFATMQANARSAFRHFEEQAALYEQLGDPINQARGLSNCGFAVRGEDPAGALGYLRHGLALCEQAGDPFGVAWLRLDLGEALFVAGRDDEAEPLVVDGQRRLKRLGAVYGVLCASVILGHAFRRQHRWREAIEAYAGAIAWERESPDNIHGGDVLVGLGVAALAVGRADCAAWMFGAGHAWDERYGTRSLLDPRRELDAPRAAAEERLIDPDWAIRYRMGRQLTREQALERASSDAQDLLTRLVKPRPSGLTARELQVVGLVADGLSDADVAAALVLSRRTVHNHLRSVFVKLGVKTRTAAVHELNRLGVLEHR
jgi:non-specific serine/threonine protein kinase